MIALDFCIGSNLTAGDTELSLRTLPDYSIRLLGEPFRLAIRIGKLEHTDYLLNNSGLNSGLISGSFSVSGADDDSYTLYFQLNSNAMYAVSASDGTLTVTGGKLTVSALKKALKADEKVVIGTEGGSDSIAVIVRNGDKNATISLQ